MNVAGTSAAELRKGRVSADGGGLGFEERQRGRAWTRRKVITACYYVWYAAPRQLSRSTVWLDEPCGEDHM